MKMEQCSETSAYKIQTPGNYPQGSTQRNITYWRFEELLFCVTSYKEAAMEANGRMSVGHLLNDIARGEQNY
jgi:hypothetical protein